MTARQPVTQPVEGRLHLTTFGAAALACISPDGHTTAMLSPGKPLGLLIYLALCPGRTATREHLIDLLWADSEPDGARHALRQAIWFLHQRIGAQTIVATNTGLSLASPIDSDRDAFVAAVDRRDFECAVELYRGEFLPGFAAPGGADFEHWADLERDRLRLMFRRTAETVVRDWLSRGRLRKARQLAVRIRDQNPHDESAWRLVLETLAAANDRVQAELEAEALERQLAQESRSAERSTSALLAVVRQHSAGDDTGTARMALHAELVGREQEFATILEAWQTVQRGGQQLHVIAAPGLGKTRLLNDVHARLRAMGAQVVYVRASPGNRPVAYALASDVALALAGLSGAAGISRGAASALVALNPSLSALYSVEADRAIDAEGLRRRAIAVHELLGCVAEEHPVALLIDDVHWADPPSQELFDDLLGRLSAQRVLAVTSARSLSDRASAPTAAQVLTLDPLSVDDVLELLAGLGRLPSEAWARHFPAGLHAATHGSPLLVLQSLRRALERGWLELEDGEWRCRDWEALATELARGGPMRARIAESPASERSLLLFLGLAGTPLGLPVLADAAGRDPETVQRDLLALEVRGLVARDAHEWVPAHDEIAARVVELSAEVLEIAYGQLGVTLSNRAGADPGMLRRAGHNLLAGGQRAGLQAVFDRWVIAVRRQGDDRSVPTLARDFVGSTTTDVVARSLARSAPWTLRWTTRAVRRASFGAAATFVLAAVGAAAAMRRAPPPPDAVLVVVPRDSAAGITAVPLRSDRWAGLARIEPQTMGASLPALAGVPRDRLDWVPSPVDGAWAFSHLTPDSGGINLYIASSSGRVRRITTGSAEDDSPTWSPDGRAIAFSTDRWDRTNHWQHLAVIDLASGDLRRLTSGPPGDVTPYWSPDGTRIAFRRTNHGSGTDQLCWVAVDGSRTRCLITKTASVAALLGWYDPAHILVTLRSGDSERLVAIDAETWTVTTLGAHGDLTSPDGRWTACLCSLGGEQRRAWRVFPTGRPDDAREVVLGDEGSWLRWATAEPARAYLDTFRLVSAETIAVNVSHRLWVDGRDPTGRRIDVPVVSWRSDAPSVATVDDSGIVTPLRAGEAVVRASAGGWRDAAVRLVIRPATSRTVLQEDWSAGLVDRWKEFGDPAPTVTGGPGGKGAFWNRGDGWFHSGAYSRQRFDASHGLGLEARVSTPIVGPRAQELLVSMVSWLDSTLLARWDHRSGVLPQGAGGACGALVPGGEHEPEHHHLNWTGTNSRPTTLSASQLRGAWWTIRLQILPDGRCVGTINGRVLSISATPLRLDRPFGVLLQGSSLGSKVLVGPLEIWEGVRTR